MKLDEVRAVFMTALGSVADKRRTHAERVRAASVASVLLPLTEPDEREFAMFTETIARALDCSTAADELAWTLFRQHFFDQEHTGRVFRKLALKAFAERCREPLALCAFFALSYDEPLPSELIREGEIACAEFNPNLLEDYKRAVLSTGSAIEAQSDQIEVV